jgi:hypothetical protein
MNFQRGLDKKGTDVAVVDARNNERGWVTLDLPQAAAPAIGVPHPKGWRAAISLSFPWVTARARPQPEDGTSPIAVQAIPGEAAALDRAGSLGSGRQPPQRRIPAEDIVFIGEPREADAPLDLAELVSAPENAPASHDGAVPRNSSLPPRHRAFLVLALGFAILGAVHVVKRQTKSQVIVVPATADERSVIT